MSSLFTHKNDNCQHITVGRKLRKEIVNSNICHWLNPVFNSVTNLLGELKKFEFSCLQSKIRREEGNKFSGKTSNIFFSYYKLRLQDYHTQRLENINEKARTWDVRWLVNGTMHSFSLPSSFPTSRQFSSVQLLSGVQLFVTPWTTARQASLSITNSQSLLKPMSIESVMPSKRLILCHPLLLLPSIFPSTRVFSNESVLHIAKCWSFSFNISPSNEYSGLSIPLSHVYL